MAAHRTTVLQIIPTLDTGGAELSTVEIAAAVVAAGGRAIVASEGGRLAERIVASGGEFVPFPAGTKNPLRMIANAGRLAGLIVAEQVDLVHARSRAPAWSALMAARRTKRPFVTTYHGAYNEGGRFKRAYNRVMASGDLVIANSAYTADLVKSRYGTPADRLRIIHRGVDETLFDRSTLASGRIDRLREGWGLTEGVPVILQAARLTRWKGQTILIEALARLAREAPSLSWTAVLAGDDQGRAGYRAELETLIRRLGLAGRVVLPGHADDMPAAFALASVAVIGSVEPEAFGRTSIEAQRMGCPVIATRLGAPPETVLSAPEVASTARTGWLVTPGDTDALARALNEALTLGGDERRALAERAAHHAGTRFTLDAMRRATLAVYDELLSTSLAGTFDAARASGSHAGVTNQG